ncbi:MAG: hypothetical protein R3A44_32590 [Caldilineaceae bacterium]
MELTLTPDIENAIIEQAIQKGIPPQQLALEGLRKLFIPAIEDVEKSPPTLADFLSGYIGVLHSSEFVEGGAQLSENTGAKFTQMMRQKRAQDRL